MELKEVKLREDYFVMDPEKAVEMVDENTICVAAILGSTLNGEFEDVKRLNDLLIEKNNETGYFSFPLLTPHSLVLVHKLKSSLMFGNILEPSVAAFKTKL